MNSLDIKKKINKYQLKMENTSDSKKKNMYSQKINHYKSLALTNSQSPVQNKMVQKGGDSTLLQSAIDKQQQEVLAQIEKIKSSMNSDSIIEQINEAAKSSSNIRDQYNNLGQEVRDTVGSYASSFKEIINELEGITSGEFDIEKIMGSIQVPGSVDELIINSLAKDIAAGKDVSAELNLYGISESDPNLTAAVEKLSGNPSINNVSIPQTDGEEVPPGTGSEESVVPNTGLEGGHYYKGWL